MSVVIAALLLAIALFGAGYNVFAALLLRRPCPVAPAQHWPSVTILKPLHGLEPALPANLATFFAQDYPGPVQIIFGARSPTDPALALAREMAQAHGDTDAAFVADATRHGANNKLSNLTNMMVAAKHEIIVVADSDVAWTAGSLRLIVAAMADPKIGLVSCLLRGRGDAGFWSRLAAMDIAYRYMPSVVVGTAIGLARPVLGPTHALRRSTLDTIGGFVAFADVLADDYEIGRAVRGLGLETRVTDFYVTHGCADPTLPALVAHELRWSVTIFRIDPLGFAGSAAVHALPIALIGAAAAQFSVVSQIILAATLAARILVKQRMDHVAGGSAGPLWLLPARDLLSFALFCATFFIDKVNWRGTQFRVTRDGKLHS
ncbi:MAG: bacteriohopanetetrol glucosamine biosynthesis glycosyltransferase HpnI [Sphingomonas sp.]|nr:bacteriohopanetetrol glucosamine biosynthesis glycosyltransferase HpnI [Sphingomonas sp.]